MTGFVVPQLSRKLRMLVDYGHHESLKAVARTLGRSPITLRGWVSGGSGTVPECIPQAAVPAFLALYANALPNFSVGQLRHIVCGPADDLEALLAARAAPALMDLIEREADRSSGTVFVREEGALSLVRVEGKERGRAEVRLELGRAFRIEFATNSRAGFTIAFQCAPGGWGLVPCALDRKSGRLLLPGFEEEGTPAWMCEENETGPHLFIAAQASRPFPAELAAAARDGGVLSHALLASFARNFESQGESGRRLFECALEVVRSPAPGRGR